MDERQKRKEAIDKLCTDHECSEKIRKIHFDQFVNRKWHPHPSTKFEAWWKSHPDCELMGVDAKRAYNCVNYRREFLEAKQYGVT